MADASLRFAAAAREPDDGVARGEFLVLLNNDLVLTRHWLEPMLAVHKKLQKKAGVIGNVQRDVRTDAIDHCGVFINSKAKPEHDIDLPPAWWRFLRPMKIVPAVTGACALVARTVWDRLGGFDEKFSNGGEDVDLCFRAAADGLRNAVSLRSVIGHHISASPGRKLRDEQNSQRLAFKWRAQLEQLAVRSWCWDYLVRNWTSSPPAADHASARAALLYVLHVRRSPPPISPRRRDARCSCASRSRRTRSTR
jgi:GT2 family glycosyltransferase